MSHTTTLTTTETPLETLPAHPPHPTNLVDNFTPAEPLNIVEASLIADSAVPEGGYGWAAIAGCAVLTWWFLGMSYSWGIMQLALVNRGLSSTSTLSFIGALCAAFNGVLALVHARFIRLVGIRTAALVGISCLGGGTFLSGFCIDSVGGLFVTAGVVMGVGTSLLVMIVSVTPAQYFSKKRGLATGVIYAFGGLGGTILAITMNSLIGRVGPAWTYRILGLMTLVTGLPAAWLVKERIPIRKNAFIDKPLLKDYQFVLLFTTGFLATFYLLVPAFFIPLYSNSLGLSQNVGAGILAAFNFSSAVGRLLCGIMCDKIGPVNTLFMSLLLSATSMLVLWPFSTSLGPLITFAVFNGIGNGGYFSAMPTVVGSLFGSLRISVAMGMIITGWGPGYLLGAPIAGYLLEAYGGENGPLKAYRPAIFFAGSMALTASLLVGLIKNSFGLASRAHFLVQKCSTKKRKGKSTEPDDEGSSGLTRPLANLYFSNEEQEARLAFLDEDELPDNSDDEVDEEEKEEDREAFDLSDSNDYNKDNRTEIDPEATNNPINAV